MTNKENEKIEEKEQESNVFIDNLGRLNIKGQEIYVDAEGNTKVFDFQLTKPRLQVFFCLKWLNFRRKLEKLNFLKTIQKHWLSCAR